MKAPAKRMSMRGVRTFCVAARHGSFRVAAEELFITASAVSHQVKKLEDELGVRLFERRGRDLELTEAGRILYDEADSAIRRLDTVAEGLRPEATQTTLRVSVQPFFASEMFVPRLSRFTALHPEIDISVDTSDESVERHPPNADVSIRLFAAPPKGLAATALFPLMLVPACSPEFRARLNMVGWNVREPFPLVVHTTRPDAWRLWSEFSGIHIPKTRNVIRLDSMIAVARAVERGLGAALLPLPLSNAWFQSGSLVRLFDQEMRSSDAYYVVYENQQGHRAEVHALRDWVLQEFGDRS
ncbi:MAG: LysR substrate-binding domain-containing protein [Woeseiaceae bacterium]|nr:LysR substrate-binding domain-containing protein [Woeseiaceae bacterium]